jgi:hypothetical protein
MPIHVNRDAQNAPPGSHRDATGLSALPQGSVHLRHYDCMESRETIAHAAAGEHELIGRRTAIALAAIVATGLALRLGYLTHALAMPGFAWEDPDMYMRQALRLARDDGWRWTFDAVTHTLNRQRHALPPMYPVFLSGFALFPGFPVTALVGQAVLGALAVVLVFDMGRLVHSVRAGLIAAAGFAIWVPNIFNVWSTSQETLYIPLVLLAFVVLGRAVRARAPAAFALAGVIWGVAALTRSMPLFYLVPAAVLYVVMGRDRGRRAREAIALAAGFLLLVAPYSVALSRHFGQPAIVDTHGSLHFEARTDGRTPGLFETAAAAVGEVAADPAAYVAGVVDRTRSLLHVNGGRILQIYVVAAGKAGAFGWKTLVHAGADGILLVSALLAGAGAAICRGGQFAALLLLWAAVNLGIATLGGFGGARLRTPFEPMLMVLAAVCFAGGVHVRRRSVVVAGIVPGLLAAAAILPQVPRSLAAWPDYGITWPSIFRRDAGIAQHRTGFNLPLSALGGRAAGTFTLAAAPEGRAPAVVAVRVDGVHVQTVQIALGSTARVAVRSGRHALAYVELDADREAAPLTVSVGAPGS